MILNNKTYNVLKHVAAIGLPAVSALYYAIAQIWNISHPGQIMATISAVNVFLGAILGISTAQYNSGAKYDGVLEVMDTATKKTFNLDLGETDLNTLDQKSDVTLKVTSVPPQIDAVGTPGNPPTLGA